MDLNSRTFLLGASGKAFSYTGYSGTQSWNGASATNVYDASLNTGVAGPNHGAGGDNTISSFFVNVSPTIPNATLVEVYANVPVSANQNYHAFINGSNIFQMTENAVLQWQTIYTGAAITLSNFWMNMASPGGNNNSPSVFAVRVNGIQVLN